MLLPRHACSLPAGLSDVYDVEPFEGNEVPSGRALIHTSRVGPPAALLPAGPKHLQPVLPRVSLQSKDRKDTAHDGSARRPRRISAYRSAGTDLSCAMCTPEAAAAELDVKVQALATCECRLDK